MKAINNPVPEVPCKTTDHELIRHIEHHFPRLAGPLRTLLDRFEANLRTDIDLDATQRRNSELAEEIEGLKLKLRQAEEVIEGLKGDHTVFCPNCGTLIQLNLELDE